VNEREREWGRTAGSQQRHRTRARQTPTGAGRNGDASGASVSRLRCARAVTPALHRLTVLQIPLQGRSRDHGAKPLSGALVSGACTARRRSRSDERHADNPEVRSRSVTDAQREGAARAGGGVWCYRREVAQWSGDCSSYGSPWSRASFWLVPSCCRERRRPVHDPGRLRAQRPHGSWLSRV
jgi:hypothetical protein